MKAIERDSNCLCAHGSYMEDYRDAKGNIWRTVMPVSECVGKNILLTAMVAEEMKESEETYTSTLLKEAYDCDQGHFFRDEYHDYFWWLRVSNKDIVITHVDHSVVTGLTNRDGRMYAI